MTGVDWSVCVVWNWVTSPPIFNSVVIFKSCRPRSAEISFWSFSATTNNLLLVALRPRALLALALVLVLALPFLTTSLAQQMQLLQMQQQQGISAPGESGMQMGMMMMPGMSMPMQMMPGMMQMPGMQMVPVSGGVLGGGGGNQEQEQEEDEEEVGPGGQRVKSVKLPLHGNPTTFNINNLLFNNVMENEYFKALYQLRTYHEVIDEIYRFVSILILGVCCCYY